VSHHLSLSLSLSLSEVGKCRSKLPVEDVDDGSRESPIRARCIHRVHPSACPKAKLSKPNPVFLFHLGDLRGAIIVAGRKNFATEVKQSLEAEIKKRGTEDPAVRGMGRGGGGGGEREREREKQRDIQKPAAAAGVSPGSTVIRVTIPLHGLRSLLPRARRSSVLLFEQGS